MLDQLQEESFGSMLFSCARLLDGIAQAQVNREAGARVARPALMRLVPYLDDRGIRPTDLARRIDVSKQAVGQSLAELESRGYVEYLQDPDDGRARLVRLTPAGIAAFRHGLDVLAFFEGELRARVGTQRMARTFRGLTAMLAVLEEWERTGAPARSPMVSRAAARRGASSPARRRTRAR